MSDSYLLNIDKPADWTSFDVVKKVRGILGVKRVGHLGTLDPFATGVLPLAVGKATKLIQYLQHDQKEYIAEFKLGQNSTTCDPEGELDDIAPDTNLPIEEIESALVNFVGEKEQVPPKASAVKVNGRRAYSLARAGEDFELKGRVVRLDSVEIIAYSWPVVKVRIVCGKGYYVRSLARDLGAVLDVGGYVISLQRTRVGLFTSENWQTIEGLETKQFVNRVEMLEAWGDRPKYYLQPAEWKALQQGQFVKARETLSGVTAGVIDQRLVCLLEEVDKLSGMVKVAVNLAI